MVGREFSAARMVAETLRRLAPPSLARIPDTGSVGRRPRLDLGHPRIDDNHRPTSATAVAAGLLVFAWLTLARLRKVGLQPAA